MTLNLTDEEMSALEALAAKKDVSPPTIFRLALRSLQAAEHERECGAIPFGPLGLTAPSQQSADDKLAKAVEAFMPSAEVAFLWSKETPTAEEVQRYRERYWAVRQALAALKSEPAQ